MKLSSFGSQGSSKPLVLIYVGSPLLSFALRLTCEQTRREVGGGGKTLTKVKSFDSFIVKMIKTCPAQMGIIEGMYENQFRLKNPGEPGLSFCLIKKLTSLGFR